MSALAEFGFGNMDLQEKEFTVPNQVFQFGVPPVRIDIVTSISGVEWKAAAPHRVKGAYGDTPVSYIGKSELIKNKRAIGRHKDLADLEALGIDLSE